MEKKVLPRAWGSLMNSSSFLPVIVDTIKTFYDAGWRMEPKKHDFYEMIYVKNGRAVINIAGKVHGIYANDIIIIKPLQTHKLDIKSKPGCELIVLSFKFETGRNSEVSEVSINDFLNFVSSDESGVFITLNAGPKKEILLQLDKILRENGSSEIDSEFLNYLRVMELFVLLSRALKTEWENSLKDKSLKIRQLIEISEEYLRSNFEKAISPGDAARYVFLSPSYFTRAFREYKGSSPMNYLMGLRIGKACELLRGSEGKIIDIALEAGFCSQQRFNAAFKASMGLSPMQFRLQCKKH